MAAATGIVAIYPYHFEAEIERYGVGKVRKVWYQVLMLPQSLRAELPFDEFPRLRVEGEIADVPMTNAFIPTGNGRNYVIVGPGVRKAACVGLGDHVEMRFRIADQDSVDVPAALYEALQSNPAFQSIWDELTPGKQRAVAQHVKSAKTEATRKRRLEEAVEVVMSFEGRFREWRDIRKRET